MSQRIRGQEATVLFIVDGDTQGGSFSKATNVNITPRQEVVETDFVGEQESDLDFNHRGFDFDMDLQHEDPKILRMLQLIVEREKLRLPHPKINMVVTFAFRDLTNPAITLTWPRAFVKVDSVGIPAGKDYITSKISGKSKFMDEVSES